MDGQNTLIHFGGALKALDETGRIGGYLVTFSDGSHKDLVGDYFDAKTYLGAHDANGCDTLFHHGIPVKAGLESFAEHLFQPIKATRDDVGIFAETILNLADAYEAKVYELVKAGKLGWSSGAASHTVKRATDGYLKRWIIAEASMTPIPAEPLHRVQPIQALKSLPFVPLVEESASADAPPAPPAPTPVTIKGLFEAELASRSQNTWDLWSTLHRVFEKIAAAARVTPITGTPVDVAALVSEAVQSFAVRLAPAVTEQITEFAENPDNGERSFYVKSNLDLLAGRLVSGLALQDHSNAVVSAVEELAAKSAALSFALAAYGQRVQDKQRFREETKAGRTISAANRERLSACATGIKDTMTAMLAVHDDLVALLDATMPKEDAPGEMADGETKAAPADVLALYAEFLRLEAQHLAA